MKENIENAEFTEIVGQKYLSYALSTIMSRSLPDVRDGLKPVHRRLLYAMLQLKLDPKSGFKKCARIVGDVIGKFHPHGDTAVYETLVRLAQDFSVRYPLIEGQGNFGSVDGDNAAAMRYTESKLTNAAMALLGDIDKDTVDYKPTYDGNDREPTLLPACFPHLLANGSEGIAVGMATSIPPHNIEELIEASIALIKNPNIKIEDLINYIKGPDFPTGGIIVEPSENITSLYKTGRGSVRVRSKWEVEELPHGSYQIVVSEIPYQVQKSRLIEKIADLYRDKRLPLLGNIKDESTDQIRIIFEPKSRNIDADILMESLFKQTDLEVRINVNMNVLDKNSTPSVMNLKQILEAFLDFRYDLIVRRSKFVLAQVSHRLKIVEALLIAYLNLDEVIQIIRDEDDAKNIIIEKFSLSDFQAEAILNIRLRSLKKLEEIELKNEANTLKSQAKELSTIIENKNVAQKLMISELKSTQKKFDTTRKTIFATLTSLPSIDTSAFVEKEPITIVSSRLGWIRAYKGHNVDSKEIKYKETDSERFIISATTIDKLIIFVSNGRFYTLACDKIAKAKGQGDSIRLLLGLDDNTDIITMFIYKGDRKFLIASNSARAFIVEESEVIAQTKSGKQILNLKSEDKALICKLVDGDHIAVIGTNRKLLIYPIEEIPVMKKGSGIALQKYTHAVLSDLRFINSTSGLNWSQNGKVRYEKNIMTWLGKRSSIGRLPPTGFPKNNKFEG